MTLDEKISQMMNNVVSMPRHLNPIRYHLDDSLLYLYKSKVELLLSGLMNYENATIIWHKIKNNNYVEQQ